MFSGTDGGLTWSAKAACDIETVQATARAAALAVRMI
jgi:hypothetical protein